MTKLELAKIKKDRFYGPLFEKLSSVHGENVAFSIIENAGFFFDSSKSTDFDSSKSTNFDESNYALNLLCTPLHNIQSNYSDSKENCVLIVTGGMCPTHAGHVEMLVRARERVEKMGYNVAAGYVSPGHDEYINTKFSGKYKLSIDKRLSIAASVINASGEAWIDVDPWEGLFNDRAVNFTEVIDRLEKYIAEHFKRVKVFYVCGGDNARFYRTFQLEGNCVIVTRPGYEISNDIIADLCNYENRVLVVEGNNSLSSTSIRAEQASAPNVKKKLKIRSGNSKGENYIVSILKMLDVYSDVTVVGTETHPNIDRTRTISLDVYTRCKYNLEISRLYDVFGTRKIGYTNRPGSDSLTTQLNRIKQNFTGGDLTLFDDDIYTGGTVNYVKNMVEEQNINIDSITALSVADRDNANVEILDAVDFIYGLGGLVVSLPDKTTARALYTYPYVNVYSRCSVFDGILFSLVILTANYYIFKDSDIRLSDIEHNSYLLYCGYEPSEYMASLCFKELSYLLSIASNEDVDKYIRIKDKIPSF